VTLGTLEDSWFLAGDGGGPCGQPEVSAIIPEVALFMLYGIFSSLNLFFPVS